MKLDSPPILFSFLYIHTKNNLNVAKMKNKILFKKVVLENDKEIDIFKSSNIFIFKYIRLLCHIATGLILKS